ERTPPEREGRSREKVRRQAVRAFWRLRAAFPAPRCRGSGGTRSERATAGRGHVAARPAAQPLRPPAASRRPRAPQRRTWIVRLLGRVLRGGLGRESVLPLAP